MFVICGISDDIIRIFNLYAQKRMRNSNNILTIKYIQVGLAFLPPLKEKENVIGAITLENPFGAG